MNIGVNTYGTGTAMKKDMAGTLEKLKRSGITAIEPLVDFNLGGGMPPALKFAMKLMGFRDGFYDVKQAEKVIALWREHGFRVSSIHLSGVPMDAALIGPVVDFMKKNQICYGVYSPKEKTIEAVKPSVEGLKQVAEAFAANGLALFLHNHAEQHQDDNGTCVINYLMDTIHGLHMQLDVGWAEYAGVKSRELIEKYGDRIDIIHVKDIQKDLVVDQKKPFCVAPGTGIIPLEEIVKMSSKLNLAEDGFIIDQDNSVCGDILKDIAEGAENMRRVQL